MYKMKVKKAYMKSINDCVKCPKGETVDLPEDIAKAWLKHGFCEEVSKPKFTPVVETAVVDPVEETKAPKVKRKSKK